VCGLAVGGASIAARPGWDQEANPLPAFVDVREVQRRLDDAGVTLTTRADPDAPST
jgi:hypothetical protein